MYLESLVIKNYRKFGDKDNTVYFVEPKPIVITSSDTPEQGKPLSVISPSTTLIIGKNNAGKTTIANAIKLVCDHNQPKPSDFNIRYLRSIFYKYHSAFDATTTFDKIETPNLEFRITIKVDFKDNDLMTNLASFISIKEPQHESKLTAATIVVKVEMSEESSFKDRLKEVFENPSLDENEKFDGFYELLSFNSRGVKSENKIFKIKFYNEFGDEAQKFALKSLINIQEIKANRHLKDGVLSDVFNKIVGFQFDNDIAARKDLDSKITSMNSSITSAVGGKSHNISNVLQQIESTNHVDLNLKGNITYESVIKGLIKYNFIDDGDYIPEDQFGLGYINLLNIIGEIIHFVDSYKSNSYRSYVNLLFIEEPEAFMHPQMQEFFITRIDNAVTKALQIANESSEDKKILQCQIAITTHSSHIVNSKIHSSNSFNNINYLSTVDKSTKVVNLNDDVVLGGQNDDALKFLKKHIKYKVSELFFSDAVVFVEGVTEETLLHYYLDNHLVLSKFYISIFNINGAHGKLYFPLAKALNIPCLIITDLDIKREKCERGEVHKKSENCNVCGQISKDDEAGQEFVEGSESTYLQINELAGRYTTNSTLIDFNKKFGNKSNEDAKKIEDIKYFQDENLYVIFQKDPIKGQYATSLEEALILTNYDNDIINKVIESCKPLIYKKIIKCGNGENREHLISNSYRLQKKLSDSKSNFSNELLFMCIANDDNVPKLPNYIINGLDWLVEYLAQPQPQPQLPPLPPLPPLQPKEEPIQEQLLEVATDDAE